MKKKLVTLLLVTACAASVSACAGKSGNPADRNADAGQESNVDAGSTESAPSAKLDQAEAPDENSDAEAGGEYGYPSEDADIITQESPLGYSMPYDPSVFTLDDTGEADVFTYHTAETLDAPVYISVQPYPDMDAETLTEGLALQSGIDGVEVQDSYFGADGVESKQVYIEKEADGVKQAQLFCAIPKGEGSLLVEVGSYIGMPMQTIVDGKIEEMLGGFTLTAE